MKEHMGIVLTEFLGGAAAYFVHTLKHSLYKFIAKPFRKRT